MDSVYKTIALASKRVMAPRCVLTCYRLANVRLRRGHATIEPRVVIFRMPLHTFTQR